jgi:hypothetical protein
MRFRRSSPACARCTSARRLLLLLLLRARATTTRLMTIQILMTTGWALWQRGSRAGRALLLLHPGRARERVLLLCCGSQQRFVFCRC